MKGKEATGEDKEVTGGKRRRLQVKKLQVKRERGYGL